MVTASTRDPFRAIYLDRAVQDIIESLGIRRGKEAQAIQVIHSYADKTRSRLGLAGKAVTDEELSRGFINRQGKEIWSNKELVNIYHRVEWSQFASIANSLFTPSLNRLWPLLHSARAIQFPQRSLLSVLADTQCLSNTGEQHQNAEDQSSESGCVTPEDSMTFPSTDSNDSRSTSLEVESLTTTIAATTPSLSLIGKVTPKPNQDVHPLIATTNTDPLRPKKGSTSLQFFPVDLKADLILHKQLVLEERERAVSRRKKEEGRFEEVQERIRLGLEARRLHLHKDCQSSARWAEKPDTVPSDQVQWLLDSGSDQPTVRFPPTSSWYKPCIYEFPEDFKSPTCPIPPEVCTLPPSPSSMEGEQTADNGCPSPWEYQKGSTKDETDLLRLAMIRSQQYEDRISGRFRTWGSCNTFRRCKNN